MEESESESELIDMVSSFSLLEVRSRHFVDEIMSELELELLF
jgi:hypothetical protein